MAGKTVTVTDSSFGVDVLKSDKPVLVDFWASWCGPCRMVAPVLEEIAEEYQDRITIAKLNVDENQKVAADYNVLGLPTMILFKDGQEVQKIVGAKPKAALLKDLVDHLG